MISSFSFLFSLIIYINREGKQSAQKTLDMLQELYEEKMVTYPRTDSQYVTEDMKETVKMLAEGMTDFLPFLEFLALSADFQFRLPQIQFLFPAQFRPELQIRFPAPIRLPVQLYFP